MDLGERTARAVMRRFGQDATYTPDGGDPVTVRVVLDRNVERTVAGMQGATMEARTQLTAHSDDLGEASRGDTVTLGSETWRLVSKGFALGDAQSVDDGHLVTWIVKPDRS
ncbi:MAG: head-tail joining protein [Halomonas sp.]